MRAHPEGLHVVAIGQVRKNVDPVHARVLDRLRREHHLAVQAGEVPLEEITLPGGETSGLAHGTRDGHGGIHAVAGG
jgi:hypothetical protein